MKLHPGIALVMLPALCLANDPPPVDLYDTDGAACLRLAENGKVDGVSIGRSTGDQRKDKCLLAWAKSMCWPSKKNEGEQRGTWFDMFLMSKVPASPPEKVDCQALALHHVD